MSECAQASPWARVDGEALVISRADYFQSDLISQDPAGGTFIAFNSDTYVEYGLTENIMLGGKVVYGTNLLSNSYENTGRSGFSELEAFAQYQFLRNDRHALSAKLTAGRPALFHPDARNGSLQDGVDIELAALYGHNITRHPIKIFTAIEAGYRKRIGSSADVIRTQVTVGFEPTPHWIFLVEGFSTISLRNENPRGADYDLIKIQPSLVYRFNPRWAIQAGASQDISTRNLAPGRSYFISLWSAF